MNGVNGVILLPDDWNTSIYALNYTNRGDAPFTTNTIATADWETMESAGAVFLPPVGLRDGTSVYYVGSGGGYWSSSYYLSYFAYVVDFGSDNLGTSRIYDRYYGLSVRLVRDAE